MKQNYPLLLFAFFCMVWSSYGQTEIFNVNGGGTFPTGWTGTNNVSSNSIDQGSYYLIDAGSPSDIITTASYDLSANLTATFKVKIGSYGGGEHNALKVEVSLDGGTTYSQTYITSVTTSSTETLRTINITSVSSDVVLRLSNNETSGRGIRMQDLILTGYGTSSTDTELNFTSATYTESEDGTSVDVCVDITNPSATTATTAQVVLTSSTAPHLTYTTQNITFPTNSSAQQCVTVNIANNTNCSDSTDYTFEIQNVSGGDSAVTGSNDATILSINDDDGTSGIAYIQDFDGGTPTWNYTINDEVNGKFEVMSSLSNINYTNISGDFFGINDADDSNNSIEFATVSTAGMTNIVFSFDYDAYKFDNGDDMFYELFYDGVSQGQVKFIDGNSNYSEEGTKSISIPDGTNYVAATLSVYQNGGSDYGAWDNVKLTADLCLCSAPADPTGSITGTTPACTSTDLTFTGTTPSGITNYWQTTATGTDETYNASTTYTATTSGTYYVRAYDTAGTCWSDGNLSYNVVIEEGVPTLTQPTDQTEEIPDTATFSVSSSNTDSYQWQVNTGSGWTNVTGGSGATTDTYTTTVTSSAMHGNQYRCILTNICGDTTSNAATLSLSNESPNNARNSEGCFDDTSVTLSWDAPASGITPTGYIIFAIEGGTDPTGTKTDASTYTANTNFSAATTVTPASLGRVVYKGTATTTTITGLTEDNNYSFTIYAYVGETLTGWATGGTGGSTVTNGLAQADVMNLMATPLTNQVTLDWDNPLPTSCWDQLIIIVNQGGVTFSPSGDGSAYSGNDNDEYTTPNQLVYETTSSVSTKSITGLINDTNYCFKIFIRRGTNWTEGVEICTTPTLTYCDSYGNGSDGWLTLINNVKFNTIDNASPNTDNAYTDFTTISTTVTIGQTYNLDVNVNTGGNYTTVTRAWIDWNNDGDFSDANEVYELGNAYSVVNGSTDGSPLPIEVPTNATLASTRMRIATKFGSTASTPCQTNFDGEVEDYTINIVQPVDAEIDIKGNNISIENGFNAPYGLNNTLFASTNVGDTGPEKSFFVENIGASTLNLTGSPRVEITGAHPNDFMVTLQPNATVGSEANSEFKIAFNPTSDGVRTAQVRIENSDSNENPYIFDIEGSAECTTVLTSAIWPTEGPENTEITITSANDLTGAAATINGLEMTTVTTSASELVVLLPNGATDGDVTVLFSTGCSSANAFTVLNNDISSCETTASSTTPTDLFISEISDASTGSSSLVEIYNGTATTINLSNYSIRVFNNGNYSPSSTLNLTGTIASGNTHVISLGTTTCDLYDTGLNASLPQQAFDSASGINFNNDSSDLIELYNSATSTSIDVFGVFGSESWSNGLVLGENGINFHRLNTSSALPSTTFDIADWTLTDWTTCEDSDYSNFGIYDFSLATPPTVSALAKPIFNCSNAIQLSVNATEGVSSGSSLTYQWFYLAPNSSTFITIPDNADFNNVTSATLDVLNPRNYLNYQFYCQVREDTVTCHKTSNAVKLEAIMAFWNGTAWSTTPGLDRFIVIDGDYNTSFGGSQTSFSACSLVINSGKTLTITDGAYAEVYYEVNNNGTFHIENNGALIQIDDTSVNTGSMSMERKASIKNYDYVYWSSPISGFNISDIAGSYYFYWHPTTINSNGTQGNWIAANNTTMALGKGYIIRAPNGQTAPTTPGELNFTTIFSSSTPGEGVPNNGEIAVTIERGINANSDEDKNDNWNLIGNPYPSSISASDFIIENATQLQNIDGYINIWTHGTPPSAAEASPFYQNFASNYNSADYFYYNALGDSNGDGFSGYIAAGQSFMVNMVDGAEAATTTVTFKNSMRDKGYSNSDFFRASPNSSNEKHRFWLNLLTPTTPTNRILIGYTEAATMGEDLLFDAETVLGDTSAGVYSMIEDNYFLIQGRALPFTVTDIIPLSVKTIESGSHTLALHAVDGIFETDNQTIYLKDNLLGFTHDLTAQPYTFTLEPGTYNDRFEIVFIPTTLSIDDQLSLSNTITITELQEDLVQFKVDGPHSIKHIDIIDINGRLVYSLEGHNSTEVYNLSKLSQAAYMAKITLSNGQVLSKKAIKQY